MSTELIISITSSLIGSASLVGYIFERRKNKGLANQEIGKGKQEEINATILMDEAYAKFADRHNKEFEVLLTENNDLRKQNFDLKVERNDVQKLVEDLQKQVSKLSGTVAGMQSTLENDTKNYTELSKKYNSLQKAYDNLKKSYTTLKQQFENYKQLHNGTNTGK